MSDNSPQRQLAPDNSRPVSGQFAPRLWTIRLKKADKGTTTVILDTAQLTTII